MVSFGCWCGSKGMMWSERGGDNSESYGYMKKIEIVFFTGIFSFVIIFKNWVLLFASNGRVSDGS